MITSWHSSGPWRKEYSTKYESEINNKFSSDLLEPAALGCTELGGLLVAAGHGSVLGGGLLLEVALLPRPLLALLGGGVAHCDILALLVLHRLAVDHVILDLKSQDYN